MNFWKSDLITGVSDLITGVSDLITGVNSYHKSYFWFGTSGNWPYKRSDLISGDLISGVYCNWIDFQNGNSIFWETYVRLMKLYNFIDFQMWSYPCARNSVKRGNTFFRDRGLLFRIREGDIAISVAQDQRKRGWSHSSRNERSRKGSRKIRECQHFFHRRWQVDVRAVWEEIQGIYEYRVSHKKVDTEKFVCEIRALKIVLIFQQTALELSFQLLLY